jgi:hypothetical protein
MCVGWRLEVGLLAGWGRISSVWFGQGLNQELMRGR